MEKDIYELLARMKERPSMWLGSHKLTLLHTYLNGFLHGRATSGRRQEEMPPFWLIQDWVTRKYEPRVGRKDEPQRSSNGWCSMLLEACQGDETAALDLFFDLLEEFRAVRPTRVVTIPLHAANLAFAHSAANPIKRFYKGEGMQEVVPLPIADTIYIVCFSAGMGYYVFQQLAGKRVWDDGPYSSFRLVLQHLRREFGPTLAWKDTVGLSAPALAAIIDLYYCCD